jgi:hypothetical protein
VEDNKKVYDLIRCRAIAAALKGGKK